MGFHVGLDLGQAADYTALAAIEDVGDGVLHLRHLERYPLRTPYPGITEKVAALMRHERLVVERQKPLLVVDATGVGRGVVDMLKDEGLDFRAVTITGGERASREHGSWRVPKKDLIAVLEVPFHTGSLKVAQGLTLWPVLREELLNFRRKINIATGHDSFEAWRESDHDDLVLATALACWSISGPAPSVAISRPLLDDTGSPLQRPRYEEPTDHGGYFSYPLEPPPDGGFYDPRYNSDG